MTAIDKLNALREEIEELKAEIESKQEKLESLKDQCSLALDVAEEYEKEIKSLKDKMEADKEDEYEAFQTYIVEPIKSGNPDNEPEVLQYILERKLPTPDSKTEEEEKEEVPPILTATG